MASYNGNIFRITGLLCGEFTGHRFLWSAPEPKVKQTMETAVIWDAIALIMTSLYWDARAPELKNIHDDRNIPPFLVCVALICFDYSQLSFASANYQQKYLFTPLCIYKTLIFLDNQGPGNTRKLNFCGKNVSIQNQCVAVVTIMNKLMNKWINNVSNKTNI